MRNLCLLALLLVCGTAWGEACVVHSKAERIEVKVCQQNRSIPPQLFRGGFCQPQLQGQTIEVEYLEQCPAGAFGLCSDARVAGMPYRQDIHYYGVASDAAYLKPFCEAQSQGTWLKP
ncbi:MAG: NADH:ubiquinone oxidoreductase [Pseudomonadota bacterium]